MAARSSCLVPLYEACQGESCFSKGGSGILVPTHADDEAVVMDATPASKDRSPRCGEEKKETHGWAPPTIAVMDQPDRRLDENFIAELGEILAWAVAQGVSPHSRFHTYKRTIERLNQPRTEIESIELYNELETAGKLPEIASTYSESIELVATIPPLRQTGTYIPVELLRKAFSGPLDAYQESDTSNAARNAMFELNMGAMAARNGWKPTLCLTNPDVSFDFEGRCVKMECKRVLTAKVIKQRLKEGIKQLDKTVDSAKNDVGIVAISLSKLASNTKDLYRSSSEPHDDLSQELHKVLKANEQFLGGLLKPSITGFLFYTSIIAAVPGKGFSPVRSATVFPVNRAETPYMSRLCKATNV